MGNVHKRLANLEDRLQAIMTDDPSKVCGLERKINLLLEFDEIM